MKNRRPKSCLSSQPTNQSINQSINRTIERWDGHSINQSTESITNQSINWLTDQSINQLMENHIKISNEKTHSVTWATQKAKIKTTKMCDFSKVHFYTIRTKNVWMMEEFRVIQLAFRLETGLIQGAENLHRHILVLEVSMPHFPIAALADVFDHMQLAGNVGLREPGNAGSRARGHGVIDSRVTLFQIGARSNPAKGVQEILLFHEICRFLVGTPATFAKMKNKAISQSWTD